VSLGRASLNTLEGDLVCQLLLGARQHQMLVDSAWEIGGADLVWRSVSYYLHLTQSWEASSVAVPGSDIVGVDLGIANLATDNDGETFSGEPVDRVRQKMTAIKSALQKRDTKSAKRHLKKISGRESRFRRDTNHCISKHLVSKARRTHRGIALEDLRHNRSRTEGTVRKSQRQRHSSWAFAQLRAFITYKAQLAGVLLHLVDPRYTSRTCSRCGHCQKKNRKSQAEFLCQFCGFAAPADWNAAVNIARATVKTPIVALTA